MYARPARVRRQRQVASPGPRRGDDRVRKDPLLRSACLGDARGDYRARRGPTSEDAHCGRPAISLAILLASAVPAGAATDRAGANSADRMIIWTSCPQLVKLTDADLDAWRRREVGTGSRAACNASPAWAAGTTSPET